MAQAKDTRLDASPLVEPGRKLTATEVLARVEPIHARILKRRKGKPLDVDAVLDELRGRVTQRQP